MATTAPPGAQGTPSAVCTVTELTSESDFDTAIASLPPSALAVIYFHAPWAEPCKQMSTILAALASTYPAEQPPRIAFLSLDAEEVSDVSEKYDVTQVPFLVLETGRSVVETVTGSDAGKVRSAVERHAGQRAANAGKPGLPAAQKVTRQPPDLAPQTNGHSKSTDLSHYAPAASDPQHSSSGEPVPDLTARLSELVKAAPVMLFMKGTPSAPQCGFSRQTVALLRERGIRYGFFNILADDEVRQGLKQFSEWPTFPQVYAGGELVGGLDILKEEFENDAEFLREYAVSAQRNTGGPAAPKAQAQPA